MSKLYNTIGLIGKPHHEGASSTIEALHQYLLKNGYKVLIESSVAQSVNIDNMTIAHSPILANKQILLLL